jgi:hypothetical protein
MPLKQAIPLKQTMPPPPGQQRGGRRDGDLW